MTLSSWAQMARRVAQLSNIDWNEFELVAPLDSQAKMKLLKQLPPGDSVQFEDYSYDPDYPDIPRYLSLDTAGLRFIDLNRDGRLDLLYTGLSGTLGKQDTKVYFLQENTLVYHGKLTGSVINIRQSADGQLEVYTYWRPCCDSYTSGIEKYVFSKSKKGVMAASISCIGPMAPGMKNVSLKDFSRLKKGRLEKIDLVAFWDDFRDTYPYFGERNKEIKALIRDKQPVHLLVLDASVTVSIIAEETRDRERWYLVLTDPLDQIPKSLYEWSAGDNRQFIGWVQNVELTD